MPRSGSILVALGLLLLSVYAGASGWGEWERRQGLQEFALSRQPMQHAVAAVPVTATAVVPAPPAFQPTPTADGTLAVLRIPAIGLEVPVRRGTDEGVLLRGAGLVEGSAPPGSDGNVAIAAHRDSFFRGLRGLAVGDPIVLVARDRTRTYRVTRLSVVQPRDIAVLDDVGTPAITLVTCFPFHFVGRAPQRYIVRALADDPST